MVVINFAGLLVTHVADPDVVQEMYTGKNSKLLDKDPLMGAMFDPMFSDIFPFMPTNQKWKDQRKACAHMFFKQKLHIMANVFK